MTFLLIVLALIVLVLAYMRFEAGFLEVRRIDKSKSQNPLKIIQLSDIHVGRLKVPAKRIKEAIQKEKPDIIIITGDFIEEASHKQKFFDFINEIKGNHPIYACFGNHDYKAFRDDKEGLIQYTKEIEQSGIQLLHNKTICIEKGSKKYSITGIADMKYGDWNIEEALATRCKDADTILAFTHNPDAVLSMPPQSVEYLFTGHFHGGQVWLPFNLEFLTLRKEKLCRMGIRRNLHKVNDINIYINRGLGNVCLPIRFLSRPEITVFLI